MLLIPRMIFPKKLNKLWLEPDITEANSEENKSETNAHV